VTLRYELLSALELAHALDRPDRAGDPAGSERRSRVAQEPTSVGAQLAPHALDPDQSPNAVVAGPAQADLLERVPDPAPGLRRRDVVAVEVSDQCDEPRVVRRNGEAHGSSVPGNPLRETHRNVPKQCL
jgi:hypothetical protein